MLLSDVNTADVDQIIKRGLECIKNNQPFQGLLFFNQAALLEPKHSDALIHCAEALLSLNRPAEAGVYSQRVLELNLNVRTLSIHGKVQYQIGKYYQALDCFERILAVEPNHYVALSQRALCLTQVNRHEEALISYQQALTLSLHQDPWVYYNYSLCLLAMGKLIPGFIAFEQRWQSSVLAAKKHSWIVPELANHELLHSKSFLVHSEQGLGDSIQFFRYIPFLLQLGARVFVEIQPSLIPLFSAWRHSVHFIATGSPLPTCDYHCPMMSLARLFKTDLSTIPQSIPYILPNSARYAACQKKLGHTAHKRIGFAWKGSPLNTMNAKRSIDLKLLLSLHQPNLEWIGLQKEIALDEKNHLDQHQIAYHSLELSTFEGTAALIACLDLVITIDTSIAHLAAALGKEVWILLPFSADWRWFLQRHDSPWYSNVTLFRQTSMDDWSTPLTHIKNKLMTLPPKGPPNAHENVLKEAHLQFQNASYFKAEQIYRTILLQDPTHHHAAQGVALAALQQNKVSDAIQFMQLAVDIAPTNFLYRRNLGELLRRCGQLEAALTIHKHCTHLQPNDCENHFLLALTYHDQRQFALAIQHYQTAVSLDQNYGLAWNNLGASLEGLGEKQQAKHAYTEAIRIQPKHAEAHNNLGALYSEEGHIEQARNHFSAAVAANPHFIEAHYNLSQLKTYTSQDPHLSFLESLTQNVTQYSLHARIHYYFTLGKALDDVQDFTRAFKAYAEGNRLYSTQRPWNKTQLQEMVDHLPQIFTQTFLTPTQPTQELRCPIFIVGMPRAGTSLIEQILATHSHVFGAGELGILDDVIQSHCRQSGLPFHTWVSQLTEVDFADLGKQYLDRTWQLAPDKLYIVDKMPSNCFYLGLIYRMLPTAKIIHAIRDPMDSCFSCFTHLFKDNMLFTYNLRDLGHYYALYAQTMQHWQNVLPANTLFDLPYEQMVTDHEKVSKQLVNYLGLPWDPNCLNFYNNNRPVKTASLVQVRQPIYKTSLKRWQHFKEHLNPLLEIVAPYRNKKGISA